MAVPMPLVDKPREGSNAPEYTVSDLSRQLKKMVEDGFGHVRVRGEIGECKLHSSGHLYLSLKDENAVLAAVCWRGQVAKLGIKPATGMDVVCTGKLTTYMGQSKYQMTVESMALAGVGALLKMLEERRVKLAAEGLFDASRKRPLPFLPTVIGVVTSPTGAVIRDILHRLEDRFPRHVLVWPVPVQGEGAADKIAAAIRGFNALEVNGAVPRPDVLIVARGGGSLEDLMPFNEEIVVRAVAESHIPVISAVGHETDTTLVDYAADLRAPTPTAAAEKAVPVRDELLGAVADSSLRLDEAMRRILRDRREKTEMLARALGDPMRALAPLMQRFDERAERLTLAWQNNLRRAQSRVAEAGGRLRHPRDVLKMAAQRLDHLAHRMQSLGRERLLQTEKKLDRLSVMLEALSPRAVLGRGYGLVYDAAGRVIMRAADLSKGSKVRIELHDGSRSAVVDD
ncbi:MAG TPA: exodeoxyribonuclease VII large subunit [Rhodospirillaceae bacterium]|nr:exodeoxyribonuclease VII large subunit [Rhodospirillaceae bacterium]